MKVINIYIPDDLEDSRIQNENVDVFVETDDGYTYTLSFATLKHIEFSMKKAGEKYDQPGYPFILVNKLTPEIIQEAVQAFAEKGDGYWLKVYHFAGWAGAIDEPIFEQIKANHIKQQEELEEADELSCEGQAHLTLNEPVSVTETKFLMQRYMDGDKHPGIGTRAVPGTCLSELRTKGGTRVYFQEKDDIVEVVGLSDKGNRRLVLATLKLEYPPKE